MRRQHDQNSRCCPWECKLAPTRRKTVKLTTRTHIHRPRHRNGPKEIGLVGAQARHRNVLGSRHCPTAHPRATAAHQTLPRPTARPPCRGESSPSPPDRERKDHLLPVPSSSKPGRTRLGGVRRGFPREEKGERETVRKGKEAAREASISVSPTHSLCDPSPSCNAS